MFSRDTQTIDLTELLRPFEGKWVAISQDYAHVLASADSFTDLQRLAKKIVEKYIVFKVFPFDVSYIPRGE